MALFKFKRKSDGDSAEAKVAGASRNGFKRDQRKARAWFDRAQTVADTRNYDYAIECFISGLRHDPDNMQQHEKVYDVAKRRKVSGGKPAGLKERMSSLGKDPVSRLLDAEKLWAKDPLNVGAMLAVMKRAVEADEAEEDVNLAELAYWIGAMLLEANQSQKRPSKSVYIEARDLFSRIGAFGKSVEACKLALSLDESDDQLLIELRDLEAERTMHDAQYGKDFRASIRQADKQRELEMADETGRSQSAIDELIIRYRADYEKNNEDIDTLNKLVKVLEQKATEETEDEAIRLLHEAHQRTDQYRFKARAGDIQMRQNARHVRMLKQAAEGPDASPDLVREYTDLLKQSRDFELAEYKERAQNYPTDLRLRFELGKRLYLAKQFDEAIGAFQEAQGDPKNRSAALNLLGGSYIAKGYFDEGIETLRRGIEHHPLNDDRLALEMRYRLMEALEQSARRDKSLERAREARELASQVLQTDINFRDIRERVEALRQLVDQLQKDKGDAA